MYFKRDSISFNFSFKKRTFILHRKSVRKQRKETFGNYGGYCNDSLKNAGDTLGGLKRR